MNRGDELRKKFREKVPLEHLTISNVYRLWILIDKELRLRENDDMRMVLNPLNDIQLKSLRRKGYPQQRIQITVNGSYFEKREAVTFHSDRFVGFCGWASSDNAKPFWDAFEVWVDTFKIFSIQEGLS